MMTVYEECSLRSAPAPIAAGDADDEDCESTALFLSMPDGDSCAPPHSTPARTKATPEGTPTSGVFSEVADHLLFARAVATTLLPSGRATDSDKAARCSKRCVWMAGFTLALVCLLVTMLAAKFGLCYERAHDGVRYLGSSACSAPECQLGCPGPRGAGTGAEVAELVRECSRQLQLPGAANACQGSQRYPLNAIQDNSYRVPYMTSPPSLQCGFEVSGLGKVCSGMICSFYYRMETVTKKRSAEVFHSTCVQVCCTVSSKCCSCDGAKTRDCLLWGLPNDAKRSAHCRCKHWSTLSVCALLYVLSAVPNEPVCLPA